MSFLTSKAMDVRGLLTLTSQHCNAKQAIWSIQHTNYIVGEPEKDCVYGSNDYEEVDINRKCEWEWKCTSLILAVMGNREDRLKFLLAQGANPDVQDYEGWTALMHASRQKDDMFKILLAPPESSSGADPNIQNREGETVLIYASMKNRINIVKILLAPSESSSTIPVDPNIQDNKGCTALRYALKYRHNEIVRLLRH